MDSPGSVRGKGRFSKGRRQTFPAAARSSSQQSSESFENPVSATPAATGTGSAQSSFTFDTPSPSNSRGYRMRTRHQDTAAPSPDEPGSKGGRSLRKRARIDYTSFGQEDDEETIGAKATPSTTRSVKKRKADTTIRDDEFKDESETRVKRRASEQPQRAPARRSNPRKSTVEPQPFVAEQQEEDVPVQDTIEVGGHHSEISEESFHQSTSSETSKIDIPAPAPTEAVSSINTIQIMNPPGQVVPVEVVSEQAIHEHTLLEKKHESEAEHLYGLPEKQSEKGNEEMEEAPAEPQPKSQVELKPQVQSPVQSQGQPETMHDVASVPKIEIQEVEETHQIPNGLDTDMKGAETEQASFHKPTEAATEEPELKQPEIMQIAPESNEVSEQSSSINPVEANFEGAKLEEADFQPIKIEITEAKQVEVESSDINEFATPEEDGEEDEDDEDQQADLETRQARQADIQHTDVTPSEVQPAEIEEVESQQNEDGQADTESTTKAQQTHDQATKSETDSQRTDVEELPILATSAQGPEDYSVDMNQAEVQPTQAADVEEEEVLQTVIEQKGVEQPNLTSSQQLEDQSALAKSVEADSTLSLESEVQPAVLEKAEVQPNIVMESETILIEKKPVTPKSTEWIQITPRSTRGRQAGSKSTESKNIEHKSSVGKETGGKRSRKQVEQDPLKNLTPYVPGAKVFYPAAQTVAEPEVEGEAVQEEAVLDEATEEVVDEDTPAGTPAATGAEDTAVNSPMPDLDIADIQPVVAMKKQFSFRQTKPVSEFINLFEDVESLPIDELYRHLSAVNVAMVAWQDEYSELRKIIDDEDNAQRYQQEEAAFLHRQKMAKSKDPDANPVRKDFIVKGIRAPKPDPMVTYARQQDKIMANAYLFDYDDRESKIGLQDPIGQRGGAHKTRLRDRPKQTAKAAELDDPNVVHGKRPRKAPNLFGDGEAVSRGSTPVPQPPVIQDGRKRRGRPPVADKNGDVQTPTSVPQLEPAFEETPKKRKGGRPRKHPVPEPVPGDPPTPPAPEPKPELVEENLPSRKRRRKPAIVEEEAYIEHATNGTNGVNGENRRRPSRPRRNSHFSVSEVPTASFYSNTSGPSTQLHDDSRPATSSSTATESTTGTYQLREKRQKKFSLDAEEVGIEVEAEQPKLKRARRAPKKVPEYQEQDFAEAPQTDVPVEAESAPAQQVRKIKIKNHGTGNGTGPTPVPPPTSFPMSNSINDFTSNPNSNLVSQPPGHDLVNPMFTAINGSINHHGKNGVPEVGTEEHKQYSTMTKSEKMSYSMRARWASGSMSPAVAKRRATLAAKKATAATSTPPPGPGPNFPVTDVMSSVPAIMPAVPETSEEGHTQ